MAHSANTTQRYSEEITPCGGPPDRFYIGKVGISAVHMESALDFVRNEVEKGVSGYICVTNVRTSVLSQHDAEYCSIQNNSLLTIPDGKPLSWYARMAGNSHVDRVTGPDLMREILSVSEERGYSHYFYGSTEKVLSLMKEKYLPQFGKIDIKGLYSPPFRPLTADEKEETANTINSLNPDFVWVGLGAPKQEFWMSDMLPKIKSSLMVGVGAAFPFAAGVVKRPPVFIQKLGFEWLFRCVQMPLTARRFIYPFFYFSGLLIKAYLSKPQKNL